MEKQPTKISEVISFAVMLMMFIALAGGEAGESLRIAASPVVDISAEIEYFRGEDE